MTSTNIGIASKVGLVAFALGVAACSSSATTPSKDAAVTGGSGGSGGSGGTGGSGGADAALADAPSADATSDAVSCPSAGPLAPPTVPDALKAPAGTTLAMRLHAEGSQIYTCTAMAPAADAGTDASGTSYGWVFKAPDAKLYDASCAQVGTHFAGPTWKSTMDASQVVGMAIANAPAPAAGSIPWLLLKAKSNTGPGIFAQITYVQRADTIGGVAPTTGCSAATAGTDQPVAYSANYYYYTGGEGIDGGATDGGGPDAGTIDAGAADAPAADVASSD